MPEVCMKAKVRILEKIMYFSLNAGVILTFNPFYKFANLLHSVIFLLFLFHGTQIGNHWLRLNAWLSR